MTVITARRLSVSFASRGTARYIGTGLSLLLLITGYYSNRSRTLEHFKSYYYYYYYYDVGSQEHNNNNNENIHCC